MRIVKNPQSVIGFKVFMVKFFSAKRRVKKYPAGMVNVGVNPCTT